MNIPDLVVICVSSSAQALAVEQALARRIGARLYPREITFCVVHDPDGGRVGSGGGTLHALSELRSRYGEAVDTKSILLVHAGGESRRLPSYAPEGKLFAPVPVPSSSLIPPVLFDVQLPLFLRYPWRDGELLVASGDVYLDFDLRSVRRERGSVCGFASPASFETGSRHGVFAFDASARRVVDYLQKAPIEELRSRAALPGGQSSALDIGLVAFHGEGRGALRTLEHTLGPRVAAGELYLDLYVELLSATVSGFSEADYLARIAPLSRLEITDKRSVFETLSGLGLNGVLVRNSTFLHFGSLPDVIGTGRIMAEQGILPFYDVASRAGVSHELLPLQDGALTTQNCRNVHIPHEAGCAPLYAEGCRNLKVGKANGANVFIGICDYDLSDLSIPDGMCLDARIVEGERYLALYHAGDSFKPVQAASHVVFCGVPLIQWLSDRGLSWGDIGGEGTDLYELSLFADNPEATHIRGYLDASACDTAWQQWFRAARRLSLTELNAASATDTRERSRRDIRVETVREQILGGAGFQSLPASEAQAVFSPSDIEALRAHIESEQDDLVAVYRQELLSRVVSHGSPSVTSVEVDYLSSLTSPPALRRSVKPDQIIWARSPVRMDFGGGWTDTPPYTLREGGRVCNVAIDLNGQPPVQVFCRPLTEPEIRFHSIDLGTGVRLSRFEELEDYRNPHIPFALPRAALCILGFTRERHPGKNLQDVLKALGGGLEVTLLAAVPKGSGLGTSSILGATVLAALERFYGVFDSAHIHTGELYRQVLQMEQMLTTGGGWQDQIGGVAGGVKYAVSDPGMRPELSVYQLDPWLFQAPEATSRYTLFYTGATRLARNILEEVVANANSLDPAYLFTLRRVASLADRARDAFALHDADALARVIAESWRENCLVHPSTTNPDIDDMLSYVRPHVQGMKLLGAGGGGYAFFVSQSETDAHRLRESLVLWARRSENPRARLVNLSLNPTGLQVTAS